MDGVALVRPTGRMSSPRLIGPRECAFFRITQQECDLAVAQAPARQKPVRRLMQDLAQQKLETGADSASRRWSVRCEIPDRSLNDASVGMLPFIMLRSTVSIACSKLAAGPSAVK
jgi:hypothetical protein